MPRLPGQLHLEKRNCQADAFFSTRAFPAFSSSIQLKLFFPLQACCQRPAFLLSRVRRMQDTRYRHMCTRVSRHVVKAYAYSCICRFLRHHCFKAPASDQFCDRRPFPQRYSRAPHTGLSLRTRPMQVLQALLYQSASGRCVPDKPRALVGT